MATDEQLAAIKKYDRALRHCQMMIDPEASSRLIRTFLAVVFKEGSSLNELADMTGSSSSTASRHLLDLSDQNRRLEPGYGLIDRRPDPLERRKNVYTLTPRGKLLAASLADSMEG